MHYLYGIFVFLLICAAPAQATPTVFDLRTARDTFKAGENPSAEFLTQGMWKLVGRKSVPAFKLASLDGIQILGLRNSDGSVPRLSFSPSGCDTSGDVLKALEYNQGVRFAKKEATVILNGSSAIFSEWFYEKGKAAGAKMAIFECKRFELELVCAVSLLEKGKARVAQYQLYRLP